MEWDVSGVTDMTYLFASMNIMSLFPDFHIIYIYIYIEVARVKSHRYDRNVSCYLLI